MKHPYVSTLKLGSFISALVVPFIGFAQSPDDEEIIELSPFFVEETESVGYKAETTLAGIGVKTDLRDIGAAVSVVTQEFLRDTASRNQEELLVYTTSTEVSGQTGNYLGGGDGSFVELPAPGETRVRGLTSADNTREFFLTGVPWEGYNVDRVDLQRGPNSMLFGIGSPAGIINTSLKQAQFDTKGSFELAFDNYGSTRLVGDVNVEVLEDSLAVRVIGLKNAAEYRQNPAFRDDDRIYAALKWSPDLFGTDRIQTVLKVNYENGSIVRNDPVMVAPYDYITPWFDQLGQATYPWVDSQYLTNPEPAGRPTGAPAFTPWLSREPYQYNGGAQLVMFPDPTSPNQSMIVPTRREIYPDSGTNTTDRFGNYVGITDYGRYAQNARLPGYGINPYKAKSLTDSSIFDFYNHLLWGPNRYDEQDFDVLNIDLSQTYFSNRLGWNVSYAYEDGRSLHWQNMSNDRLGIGIDLMEEFYDGSPNPNVGKAFVPGLGGGAWGWESRGDRESIRAKVYTELEASQILDPDSMWARMLGRHILTGTATRYTIESEARGWTAYWIDDSFPGVTNPNRQPWNDERKVTGHHYITAQSLKGVPTASGLHLPRLSAVQNPVSDQTVAWNGLTGGFQAYDVPVVDGGAGGWNGRQYTDSGIDKEQIDSVVLVWQGFLFDGLVVPTFGWRQDEQDAWFSGPAPFDYREVHQVNDPAYRLPDEPQNSVKGQTRTFSIVGYTPDFVNRHLPFDANLSVFYNKSENFQPDAGRRDVVGNFLASPSGETEEYGFTIGMLQDRITLRVNHYRTEISNATADGSLPTWTIQYEAWNQHAAQAFASYDWDDWHLGDAKGYGRDAFGDERMGYGITSDGNILLWEPPPSELIDPENYSGGFKQEAIDATYATQEAAVNSWLANPAPDSMIEAWGMTGYGEPGYTGQINSGAFGDIVVNVDTISEGWEFELSAKPITGMEIVFNASKTDAIRTNIGDTWKAYVEDQINDLRTKPMGNMRTWGGGHWHTFLNDTAVAQLETHLLPSYELALALDGASVPELRPWRYNVIVNYQFQEGRLKGLSLGGSYRWQDKQVIGYALNATLDGFDVDNRHYGPSEDAFDLWISRTFKLSDRVDCRLQLNVRNVFADKDLIPINAQPDGSYGTLRIPEPRTITLTNTISF